MKSTREAAALLAAGPEVRRPQVRLPHPVPLVAVPWASLTLVLVGWLLAPTVLQGAIYLPLLVSTVLFGIPHGALDHLVPGRQGRPWANRPWRVALYVGGYALLAALTLGLWFAAPVAAFWGFLLMSLLHWGQGDLHTLETVQGRRRSGPWSAPLTLLARGSLPILLPLLVFPEWFGRLAAGIDQAFGLPVPIGPILPGPLPALLGAGLAVVLLAYAADTLVSSRRPLLELAETGLLLLVFAVVPAPLSIGAYFPLWHAWRHLGRLLALPDGRTGARRPGPQRRMTRLALDLLPITLIALVMLAGLYVWAAPRVHDAQTFAALYLALIAALTLPHALLVALMDLPLRRPSVQPPGNPG